MTTLFLGRDNTHTRTLIHVRSKYLHHNIQLIVEPLSFIEFILRNIDRWVVTYRRRNDSKTLHHQRPSQHGWQLRKLGIWNNLHILQAPQQVGEYPGASMQPSWFLLLPGGCCGLSLWSFSLLSFLCSSASLHLEGTLGFNCLLWQGETGESARFQGLPGAILSYLPFS